VIIMAKIISVENIKTFSSNTFRLFITLHLTFFFLIVIAISGIEFSLGEVSVLSLYKFENIWEFFPWIASQFNLLLGILTITLITNEFRNNTFRIQILNGLSREDLLLGKLWMIFTVSFYAFILTMGGALAMGFLIGEEEFSWNIFHKAYMPLVYCIQTFGYLCLAGFFAFLLKRTAVSIIVFILYLFPGEILVRKIFFSDWEQYFPTKVLSGLTKFPGEMSVKFEQAIQTFSNNKEQINFVTSDLSLQLNIAITLIYSLVFVLLSYWILKRTNL